MIIRIPVIPEINDDLINIRATADFVSSLGLLKSFNSCLTIVLAKTSTTI